MGEGAVEGKEEVVAGMPGCAGRRAMRPFHMHEGAGLHGAGAFEESGRLLRWSELEDEDLEGLERDDRRLHLLP